MAKRVVAPPAVVQTAEAVDTQNLRTLSVDIGGSHLKASVLDLSGAMLVDAERIDTPREGGPEAIVVAVATMAQMLGAFDRISVGFPGVVRGGRVLTAPNLGTEAWHHYPLADELTRRLGKPTRLLNDASVQGLGVIAGVGLECVITLGTGFGFALFEEGLLAPHLELGQHPCTKGYTYDHYLGDAALKKVGREKWNRRLQKAIGFLDTLVTYDTLLVGGGNTRMIDFELAENVRIVPNVAGITGGVRLWSAAMTPVFEPLNATSRPPPEGIKPAPEV